MEQSSTSFDLANVYPRIADLASAQSAFLFCLLSSLRSPTDAHRNLTGATVTQPSDYARSSYPVNALGITSELCTPHPLYMALGGDPIDRQASYRELFGCQADGKLLDDIRLAANKGMALGDGRFKTEVESLTGRRMTAKKMGRPVGWRKKVAHE